MLCDVCKKNEATIHMTSVVNNKKTEEHLCADCAAKRQQETGFSPFSVFSNSMFDSSAFTNDFFTNMIYPDNRCSDKGITCSSCGLTYDEFNQTGKFGCDHCYDVFADRIAPLVKRLQGSLTYEGRIPNRSTGVFRTKHEIKNLRQALGKAVETEDFEKAAQLRDQIKTLENTIDAAKNSDSQNGE